MKARLFLMLFNPRSIKSQLIIFLICFALFLSVKDRDILFLLTTALAVITAAGAEAVIGYLKEKTIRVSESAVITGLILGFVLSSDEPWFKFMFAALLAVLSKHLIRPQSKHIFNPAAFGICLAILLLDASTQWKGTYLWYFLIPFGLYLAHKVRRVELLAGYALVFLVLFGGQAMIQKVPLSNIFGYASYFFIFIMTLDPKTTPAKTIGKYLFGAGAATLVFALTQAGIRFDVELLSLLAMNAAVPIFNKLEFKRGVRV